MPSKKINLTADSVKMMRMVQRKYEMDYVTFYRSLAGHFMGQKQVISDVTAARNRVESVIKAIESILNPYEDITQEKINELYASMDSVEKDMNFFTEEAKNDTELNSKLQRIFEKKNLSIDRLGQSHKMIRGRMEKMISESSRTKIPLAPEIAGFAKSVGKSALSSVLGPFGQMAEVAGKAVGGIVGRERERKRTLEDKAFAGELLTAEEETPESLSKMYRSLHGVGKSRVEADVASGYNPMRRGTMEFGTPKSRSKLMHEIPEVGATGQGFRDGKSEGSTLNFTAALNTFFSKGALTAKWTKQLLEAVQIIAGIKPNKDKDNDKKSGIEGLLQGVASFLGPLFTRVFSLFGPLLGAIGKIAGPLAAIAGAGAAGWAAGRFLGKNVKWGGETLDVHTQRGISSAMGYNVKNQYATEAESGMATPIGKRAMELQRMKGMSMRDATIQANAELGGRDKGTTTQSDVSTSSTSSVIDKVSETVKTVPIVASGLENTSKTGFDKINSNLIAMRDDIKASVPKISGVKNMSGYDAYNIRNPLLSALSYGGIDIQ